MFFTLLMKWYYFERNGTPTLRLRNQVSWVRIPLGAHQHYQPPSIVYLGIPGLLNSRNQVIVYQLFIASC